jgi:hypothetical protein
MSDLFESTYWEHSYETHLHRWAGMSHGTDVIYLYCDGKEVYGAEFYTWDEALDWIGRHERE